MSNDQECESCTSIVFPGDEPAAEAPRITPPSPESARRHFSAVSPAPPATQQPPQTDWKKMKNTAGNWIQLAFTFINAKLGEFASLHPWLAGFAPLKSNGQPYSMTDYDIAYTAFWGHDRVIGPLKDLPWNKDPWEKKNRGGTLVTSTDNPVFTAATKGRASPLAEDAIVITSAQEGTEGERYYSGVDKNGAPVTFVKSGTDSAAWLNNNPAQIRSDKNTAEGTDFAKAYGVVGTDRYGALIFADMACGYFAHIHLLQKGNKDATMGDVLRARFGTRDNADVIIRETAQRSGIDVAKKVTDFTPQDMGKFTREVARLEGWQAGEVYFTSDVSGDVRRQVMEDQGEGLDVTSIPEPSVAPDDSQTPAPVQTQPALPLAKPPKR